MKFVIHIDEGQRMLRKYRAYIPARLGEALRASTVNEVFEMPPKDYSRPTLQIIAGGKKPKRPEGRTGSAP